MKPPTIILRGVALPPVLSHSRLSLRFVLTALILATATAHGQYSGIRIPIFKPPIIQQTPAHARTYYYNHYYNIRPYGGYNYRPAWTNYPSSDTSWGYRTSRPHAKDLGIKGNHKYGHPNPRSLYRSPPKEYKRSRRK